MEPLASTVPDWLSDALQSLSVRSSVFCISELRAPWGFRVEGAAVAKFHIVLAGSGFITTGGQGPVHLEAGDVVLLPRGDPHALGSAQHPPSQTLDELVATHPLDARRVLRREGDGPLTRLLCGGFIMSEGMYALAGAVLPGLLRLNASDVGAAAWLEPVLAGLRDEAGGDAPGAQAVQARLADVFIVQALRAWLLGGGAAGERLRAAVTDAPVAAALSAIHGRHRDPWTLARLASHVGLSRTALATRFRAAVGDSPMHYLARVRLAHAAGQLATTGRALGEIAYGSGYGSDAALSKAFRREFGQAPGAYRQAARDQSLLVAAPA